MIQQPVKSALIALALACSAAGAQAVTVNPNGSLTASTSSSTVDNLLALSGGVDGFNFSGSTGSFLSSASANGYFYAAYLITTTSASAESVTTTLTNAGGVSNLSERIYAYSGSFLGDAAAGPGILQAWSSNTSLPGVTVSIISPTNLTAGQYVVELRGTTQGNFGGTLSMAPVPEADNYAMLLAGLGLLGFAVRRKNKFPA